MGDALLLGSVDVGVGVGVGAGLRQLASVAKVRTRRNWMTILRAFFNFLYLCHIMRRRGIIPAC